MKSHFLLSSLVLAPLISLSAHGQSFHVKKVKGKQAIIQMTEGSFYEGQSVQVGESRTPANFGRGGGNASRNNFIGLQGAVYQTTSNNSNVTVFEAQALYGWNKVQYEYGILGGFGMSSGNTSTTTFRVGGQFDYNFQENRPGVDSLWSVGLQGSYAMTSGNGNSSRMILYPAGAWRWFVLGNATALRFDFGYEINQASSGGTSTSSNGIKALAGLSIYF